MLLRIIFDIIKVLIFISISVIRIIIKIATYYYLNRSVL